MLKAAQAALVEFGVLKPSEPLPPFWARMSGNLVLMVYPESPPFYLVKIGIRTRLDREYHGLSVAHAAMPRNVPRPLGLTTQKTFQVLATEGVPHQQLDLRHGKKQFDVFEHGMDAYFASSVRHFQAAPAGSALDVRHALEEAASAFEREGWSEYWNGVEPLIANLPRVLQHGDLAVNNIGVADGQLVFFDWEDFGLVDLAGYDLAVALLSVHAFDTAHLRDALAAPSMEAALVRGCCARLRISTELFVDLFPAYLALFIKVKQSGGYDQAVSTRAIAALRDWVRLGHARVAAA
jgi:hypothetical protein